MNLSDQWLKSVSHSTGIQPEDLRNNVERWFNRGRSLDYIKKVLIITALARGKKLCFVNARGKN